MNKSITPTDGITKSIALDIIKEAKGLLDMASKGLPPGPGKEKLRLARNLLQEVLWGGKKGKVKVRKKIRRTSNEPIS